MTAPLDAVLRFRPAALADAEALNAVCWPERPLQAITDFLRRCTIQIQGERALALVVEIDAQIVAFALLTYWRNMGEIGDLIVTENWRSMGIGSALIAHLIKASQRRGLSCVEIGAALSNPRALALYKRLGFTEHYTLELDLGEGIEPVIYLNMTL